MNWSARFPLVLSAVVLSALVLSGIVGCGRTPPPRFNSNMVEMVRNGVSEDGQETIATILEAMFGTPDEPFVLAESGLNLKKIQLAAGPVWSDDKGSGRGLYRQHCGHCHGTTGDALGPTAAILNPYPRDYRQGKFKFKATERAAKPTDHDLEVILRQGVMGTAMPTFDLLSQPEIDALIEYVKYLSIRGEVETGLARAVADLGENEKLSQEKSTLVDEILAPVAASWAAAKDAIVNPPNPPQGDLEKSIARGRELFYGNVANCVKCHGPSALGDGQTADFDDWNKPLFEMNKELLSGRDNLSNLSGEDRAKEAARLNSLEEALDDSLPFHPIRPRNLRQGLYRGGRRPVDIYRRLYAGINGVPMPGIGPPSPGAKGPVEPDDIWHIVNYVMSLPYEPISAPPRSPIVGHASITK